MKYTDLETKSAKDLQELLKEKKLRSFELRMKLKTMQITNPNEIRENKKDIARIKTAMSTLANG